MRLQDLNSLDMGNRLHSEFTMRSMVVCCAELWLDDLKDFLQQPHPITGRRPYVGTMVDKVTDNSTKQFQLQVQSYAYRGRRKLSLSDLRLVKDQAAPVAGVQALAAAGGRACFDKMVSTLDMRCGIDLHDDKEDDQTIQMRSVCTDGEACYSGIHSGLNHCLSHADGAEDPTINYMVDLAHDQGCALDKVPKLFDYMEGVVHKTIGGGVRALLHVTAEDQGAGAHGG